MARVGRCLVVGVFLLVLSALAAGQSNSGVDILSKMDPAEFQVIFEKATHGNAAAQNVVGVAFAFGLHKRRDDVQAIYWFEKSAKKGDPNGQLNLARMYQAGRGSGENEAAAAKWLEKAAQQGVLAAQYELAEVYLRGNGVAVDTQAAAKWYEIAARRGHPEAQYVLGELYEHGVGVVQDRQQSVRWVRQAAEAGIPQAQNSLGLAYLRGWIEGGNHSDALDWFLKAASQGHVGAQINAALLYAHGDCMPSDLVSAYAWTEIARRANAQQAERLLAKWAQEMTPEQIDAAMKQAEDIGPESKGIRASLH